MDFWPFQPDGNGRDYEAEELEELENAELETTPSQQPRIVWAPSSTRKLNSEKQQLNARILLLGFNGAGSLFLHAQFENKKVIGALLLPGAELDGRSLEEKPSIQNKMCLIYEIEDDPSCLVVTCQYDVPKEQTAAWAHVLLNHIQPERTIIFDSITIHEYKTASEDLAPPFLRKLKTSAAEEIDNIAYLEPANMLTGCGAAILTLLEIRHARAWMYVSLLEMQLGRYDVTTDTLQAFEPVIKSLSRQDWVKREGSPQYSKLINMFSRKDVNHLYL
ncbi:uncharacterized protein SPPG_01981 [Spizellomyces punctatus DAOM BR117]|uniref:Uncharacterized protein n=1 Tax=Spizellomyces punctatus (strain DAOM BR117) TaxID=645134 RepID=A0A0L0HNA4_SPIPD|nr:uncharacterized protein SPPG_01981 [Spizellomyces punctatus DAOM BR117]KND02901.1 hypothetical protein SPPG_01981 [Spizellomyces punctatus DAOM BR117]|eukprot:XP_016610940.1 hypothetical protein SPPG_01981 [Spizellomyces punctatus DAOM BR117]